MRHFVALSILTAGYLSASSVLVDNKCTSFPKYGEGREGIPEINAPVPIEEVKDLAMQKAGRLDDYVEGILSYLSKNLSPLYNDFKESAALQKCPLSYAKFYGLAKVMKLIVHGAYQAVQSEKALNDQDKLARRLATLLVAYDDYEKWAEKTETKSDDELLKAVNEFFVVTKRELSQLIFLFKHLPKYKMIFKRPLSLEDIIKETIDNYKHKRGELSSPTKIAAFIKGIYKHKRGELSSPTKIAAFIKGIGGALHPFILETGVIQRVDEKREEIVIDTPQATFGDNFMAQALEDIETINPHSSKKKLSKSSSSRSGKSKKRSTNVNRGSTIDEKIDVRAQQAAREARYMARLCRSGSSFARSVSDEPSLDNRLTAADDDSGFEDVKSKAKPSEDKVVAKSILEIGQFCLGWAKYSAKLPAKDEAVKKITVACKVIKDIRLAIVHPRITSDSIDEILKELHTYANTGLVNRADGLLRLTDPVTGLLNANTERNRIQVINDYDPKGYHSWVELHPEFLCDKLFAIQNLFTALGPKYGVNLLSIEDYNHLDTTKIRERRNASAHPDVDLVSIESSLKKLQNTLETASNGLREGTKKNLTKAVENISGYYKENKDKLFGDADFKTALADKNDLV